MEGAGSAGGMEPKSTGVEGEPTGIDGSESDIPSVPRFIEYEGFFLLAHPRSCNLTLSSFGRGLTWVPCFVCHLCTNLVLAPRHSSRLECAWMHVGTFANMHHLAALCIDYDTRFQCPTPAHWRRSHLYWYLESECVASSAQLPERWTRGLPHGRLRGSPCHQQTFGFSCCEASVDNQAFNRPATSVRHKIILRPVEDESRSGCVFVHRRACRRVKSVI